MTVLWALLALLGLLLWPVIVQVLRREKRREPPQSWARTSPWAGERADTELADRARRTQAAVNRDLVARDYQDELDAFDEWSKNQRWPR